MSHQRSSVTRHLATLNHAGFSRFRRAAFLWLGRPVVKSRKSAEICRNLNRFLCFDDAHGFGEIGFARRISVDFAHRTHKIPVLLRAVWIDHVRPLETYADHAVLGCDLAWRAAEHAGRSGPLGRPRHAQAREIGPVPEHEGKREMIGAHPLFAARWNRKSAHVLYILNALNSKIRSCTIYKSAVFIPQHLMLPTHEKNAISFTLLTEYDATGRNSRTEAFQHPSTRRTQPAPSPSWG
jgi:hypothetical protein